jgi:Dockerin type I domain
MINNSYSKLVGLSLLFVLIISFGILQADIIPPGDTNGDGSTNISDAVWLINYVFTFGPPPYDFSAADVNNDCLVNISDAVMIINYIFIAGSPELVFGCTHQETTGICIGSKMDGDSSYVVIETLGNDLHIHHMNAYYNCGLIYNIDYAFIGSTIIATEFDTGEPTDCYCYFDHLHSVYYDLENAEYTLIILSIEGDTLANEIIVIDSEYGISSHGYEGCLTIEPGRGTPEIIYTYNNNMLQMSHSNAYLNCGAEFGLIVEFEQAGDTLRFIEKNISNMAAYCMCYFAVSAEVVGIPAGIYYAEVYAQDVYSPVELVERRIIEIEY